MTKRSTPSSTPNRGDDPGRPASGWPIPTPGDVLSYAYLWAREAASGQEEGLKDRPVVVVLAVSGAGSSLQLTVAPVTHSAPEKATDAVEMPAVVKRDLGLDRERSWIVVTEVKSFLWPGPDVRPLAGGDPYYGAIPDWLFVRMREAIGAHAGRGKVGITRRTE
jgi:hypothetical protein